ncbi:unnamed protein product, partial [Closterium sp. NIES-64]
APDNMSRASKGLVLFFVGAGLNDHGRGDWSYHIPKDSDVFIRVAAPLVVDLGMLGVLLHQQPMMPITFYSSPPGVSKSMSQELMEEEITAFLVRALDATQLAARELLNARATHPMPFSLLPDRVCRGVPHPHSPFPRQVEGFVSVGLASTTQSVILTSRHPLCPLSLFSSHSVVAFISYGYDLINFQPNMQHLLDSLGAVPILGRFYVDYNLTRFLHTPQLRHILSYTDPYFFRERLTMPKLLIAASNDEFFLMDDSYFYYNGLPPPTLLKFVANVDHMVIQKSYWVRPYPPTLICLSGYARP